MKPKRFIPLVTACLLLFLSIPGPAQDFLKRQLLPQIISKGLVRWHLKEVNIDDHFSQQVFWTFLDMVDRNKRFLLQEDIQLLNEFIHDIDDQILNRKYQFLQRTEEILKHRLEKVKGYYQQILDHGFDFALDETIELSPQKRDYCVSEAELRDYWRKLLKHQALIRFANLIQTRRKELSSRDKMELQQQAIQSLRSSMKSFFINREQRIHVDIFEMYINSFMANFDPHTQYFPPKKKEDFDISMTGSFEGIGALLGEKDGFVSIERIIPGGPCWRQKKLGPGDLILKVAQEGEEPVDIVGLRNVDAVKLIRGRKGSVVTLTVKKPSGQIKEVSIERGVVIVEEGFLKSALLVYQPLEHRIGYLLLPQFYRDFSDRNGKSSYADMKEALSRLKNLQVEGLILDLRWNSGGSLYDAVKIAGLFIDQGPVVQIKGKEKKQVLSDEDPGRVFDRPVIVLVNSGSASASEILAGALQDYRRAVIVGNHKTFGKGTVQTMFDINRLLKEEADDQNLGAIKFTIQKFYRVTGSSSQSRGVIPDIMLPHRLDHMEYGETHLKNSIAWDQIQPVSYQQEDLLPPLVIDRLRGQSAQRVSDKRRFVELLRHLQILEENQEKTRVSLNLEKNLREQEALERLPENFLEEDIPGLQVLPTLLPVGRDAELDKVQAERQEELFTGIRKDLYIEESIHILHDWLILLDKNQQ